MQTYLFTIPESLHIEALTFEGDSVIVLAWTKVPVKRAPPRRDNSGVVS